MSENPKCIEYSDGEKRWLQNGKFHRIDGPALEYKDGTKFWYLNDKKHRIDGPAIELADGRKYWYVRDTNITDWIHLQGISEKPTKEEQVLIRLVWG